ncbi:hypothetical protein CEXT_59611 [Caerostris extrusa]|uniref:Uncharacterized protein n=1 Tax=Caerostris extrusa TaxID=172846 RepID=A0AAV4QSM2_CAEEX|nr:hypothetical protein CEXT_59611 [Caerostris extrusa]
MCVVVIRRSSSLACHQVSLARWCRVVENIVQTQRSFKYCITLWRTSSVEDGDSVGKVYAIVLKRLAGALTVACQCAEGILLEL